VLSALAREVYTIELEPARRARAKRDLERLGCTNVHAHRRRLSRLARAPRRSTRSSSPRAPDHVPPALLEQLAIGGRLVIPVGGRGDQELWLYTKTERGVERRDLMPVRFVPLRGMRP
jgi:protein-L-isoaspartate(D-aspartate) O-methyltransferase